MVRLALAAIALTAHLAHAADGAGLARKSRFAGKWTGEIIEGGKKKRYTFLFGDDGTPYWNMKIKLERPGQSVFKAAPAGILVTGTLRSLAVGPARVDFTVRIVSYFNGATLTTDERWVFGPVPGDATKLRVEKWASAGDKAPAFRGEVTRVKD